MCVAVINVLRGAPAALLLGFPATREGHGERGVSERGEQQVVLLGFLRWGSEPPPPWALVKVRAGRVMKPERGGAGDGGPLLLSLRDAAFGQIPSES